MLRTLDWVWALLPLLFGTVLLFWIYNLQDRVEMLERKFEDLESTKM